eukprot:Pgem_evm1s5173
MKNNGKDVVELLQNAPFIELGVGIVSRNKQDRPRVLTDDKIDIPEILPGKFRSNCSTQTAFGSVMLEIGRAKKGGAKALADRILTTAPDVTTSTNLIGFVNQR